MQTDNSHHLVNNNQSVYNHLVFEGKMDAKEYDVKLSILPHAVLVTTAYRNSMGYTGGRNGDIQFNTESGRIVKHLSNYVVPYGKVGELVLFGSGNPKAPTTFKLWDATGRDYPTFELQGSDKVKAPEKSWFGASLCRETDFFTVTRQGHLVRWVVEEREITQEEKIIQIKEINRSEEAILFTEEIASADCMKMIQLNGQIYIYALFVKSAADRREEWFQYNPETNEVKGHLEVGEIMILNAVPEENNFGASVSISEKIKGLKSREKVLATAVMSDGRNYVVVGKKPRFPWSKKEVKYRVLCNVAE